MMKRMSLNPEVNECHYLPDALTIFVVGASGDLAKKKTYPALFDLHRHGFLTNRTTICGYARSGKTDEDFKAQIKPFLKHGTEEETDEFLSLCIYRQGAYDSTEDVARVFAELEQKEEALSGKCNRLFYFAIPPSVFVPIGKSIKEAVIDNQSPKVGWSRLIIEKPFGKDSESFQELSSAMGTLYTEDYIYRIDHYLGKEMVQNLVILRFSNAIFEPLWNRNHIQSVTITFKENFGTKGRGGYFDSYGIIRDVIQNHLLQVMSLVAMVSALT
jgi:glucose-6-phosphate 1-dehydrogenase